VTSVTKTPEYEALLQYWEHGGEKPSVEFAKNALMQMAANYNMENVTVMPDVIDAMFRQVAQDGTKPYAKLMVPGRVPATHYDMGSQGEAYADSDHINLWVSTGERTPWNKGRKMRNDGVDIQISPDQGGNGYEVFAIEDGEWLQFTVDVEESASYAMDVRYANGGKGGSLHVEIDGEKMGGPLELGPTGGETVYATTTLSGIPLKAGSQKIKLVFDQGGFHLNFLEFSKHP